MPSLGKYVLIQQLGTGSMGTVYIARDSILDREVALKTIRTGSEVEPEMRERFYREAKTCARLQHPGIVTVFDLGEQDGFAYIAMELLTGLDFRKIIDSRSAIDLNVKVETMIQICEGLAYAHKQGIVHRDVKPSNLFLCEDNRAKVLDFGIARLPSSRLTMAGRVLGTPNYMAPEQILGKHSDGRADLFSTAVVFFEYLTYSHPFRSDLVPRRIVDSEPDSLYDHDSSIPLPLETILARGLAKDPDRRYATGDEFAADLSAVLDGLRHNASPQFSKFLLPSVRGPQAAAPTKTPVLNPTDRSGTGEFRLSEFLAVLSVFDKALADGDTAAAESQLRNLRSTAAGDDRFSDSLKLCEEKIRLRKAAEAEPLLFAVPSSPRDASAAPVQQQPDSVTAYIRSAMATVPAAVSILNNAHDDSESAGVLCAGCGIRNRSQALFCIECGHQMESISARSPVVPKVAPKEEPPPQPDRGTAPVKKPNSLEPALTAANAALERGWVRTRVAATDLRLWWGRKTSGPFPKTFRDARAILAVAIVAALFLYLVIRRPNTQMEPYIGTASVQIPETKLLKLARSSSPAIRTLSRATRIGILAFPESGGRKLWLVQPIVNGRPVSKGFIEEASLADWHFSTAEDSLKWARLVSAGSGEGYADLEDQANRFHLVAAAFPDTPQAVAAAIEEATLRLRIGTERKSKEPQDERWRPYVEKAKALAAFIPDSHAAEITRKADELLVAVVAGPVPDPGSSRVVPVDPDQLDRLEYGIAQRLRANYDFDGAIGRLRRILKRHPDNTLAQKALADVKAAKELEQGKTQ